MNVLDLFSGMDGWSAAFKDRGHHVVSIELDKRFKPTIRADILGLDADSIRELSGVHSFDVILASPPCTHFSMAGASKGQERWLHRREGHYHPIYGPRVPINKGTEEACAMVLHTIGLVAALSPRWWWLENPQGGLKTMGFMQALGEPVTVTYCQYGETRMKPTNLWGAWPETWKPRPRCFNGDPCHEAAPRGAKTGTQGIKDAANRAVVPYQLSEEIAIACEEAKDG